MYSRVVCKLALRNMSTDKPQFPDRVHTVLLEACQLFLQSILIALNIRHEIQARMRFVHTQHETVHVTLVFGSVAIETREFALPGPLVLFHQILFFVLFGYLDRNNGLLKLSISKVM